MIQVYCLVTSNLEPENTMTKAKKTPATSSMTLLDGAEAINKAIDSIATRGKKLDRDIWVAAVSAMAHHAKHGDVTLINRLVEHMPKGSRVNALRDFITANGKVKYDEQAKCFAHDKEGNFDLDGALEKSWTDYKPEQPYTPFDASAAVKALIKKLDAADSEKGDKVTPEQDKAIRELAAKLGVDA